MQVLAEPSDRSSGPSSGGKGVSALSPDEGAGVIVAGQARHADWEKRFARYETQFPELAVEFRRAIAGELPAGWQRSLPSFEAQGRVAARSASGKVLNAIASVVPELVGGSADLAPSTDTYLEGFADGSCRECSGRNFHFGVREHTMGAVMNGLAAHGGLRPSGGPSWSSATTCAPRSGWPR